MLASKKFILVAWFLAVTCLFLGLIMVLEIEHVAENIQLATRGIIAWAVFSVLALSVVQFSATHVALGQPITLADLPRRDFFVAARFGDRIFLQECAHQWVPFGPRQYFVLLPESTILPLMFTHLGEGRIMRVNSDGSTSVA